MLLTALPAGVLGPVQLRRWLVAGGWWLERPFPLGVLGPVERLGFCFVAI